MPEDLVIVGAGGFGRETADVVEAVNHAGDHSVWNLLGIADDSPSDVNLQRLARRGIPYLGTTAELLATPTSARYVIGIGSPATRRRVVSQFDEHGWRAAVLIHPVATIGSGVEIGDGTVVCAGARLTTNITIGRHVHVNPNVTIGHDATLGDFVSLNPAASISGDCVIEDGVLVGVQGVVLNERAVRSGALVGASACVTVDVPRSKTVVGVPARPIARGFQS